MSEENATRRASLAELARPYLEKEKKFLSLNFRDPKDKNIALYCLKQKPLFLDELSVDDPNHIILLKAWIVSDYSNYIQIYKKQLSTSELLELYLYMKLRKTSKDNDVFVMQSLKKKTIFRYTYETKKGETISYFDTALGVPTLLTVTANLKIKITNPEKLVSALDYDIAIIDCGLVMDFINTFVNRVIRDTLLAFITENKLSYYHLPQFYSKLNDLIIGKLNNAFVAMGLAALEVNILDITIPNNTNEMFERQYFAIAEAEKVKRYEYRMEGLALDLYAKKAEIHSKYPEYPVTLTEAEKDFALNRHLNRMGVDTTLTSKIVRKKLDDPASQSEGTFTSAKQAKPVEPKEPIFSNKLKKAYVIGFVLFLIGSFLSFLGGTSAGLIALACTIFVFGMTGAILYPKLKSNKNTKEYQEYLKRYEEYQKEYEQYAANKDESDMMN